MLFNASAWPRRLPRSQCSLKACWWADACGLVVHGQLLNEAQLVKGDGLAKLVT